MTIPEVSMCKTYSCNVLQSPWKTDWQLKVKQISIISVPYLDIYPKGIKGYIHIKTCTWFIVAPELKQLQGPPIDEGINKLLYFLLIRWSSTRQ